MLKSIVLKNFVHFKDKIVIVLNNSQTEQRKEQSTNAGANTSPIDSYALNNSQRQQTVKQSTNISAYTMHLKGNALNSSQKEQIEEESTNFAVNTTPLDSNALNNSQRGQTEEQSTNTGTHTTPLKGNALNSSQREQTEEESTNFGTNTTPLDSNALNNSQKGQPEEESTNSGPNTSPLDSNALNNSQREQTEEQSTNTSANTTHLKGNALNSSQREQIEKESTNFGVNTTPLDSNVLNNSQIEETEEQSTNTGANTTLMKGNALNSSQKEQPEESTNSGANTTPLDSNALNNSLREKTEEQSTNTGANTTPIDRKAVINSQKEQTEEQSPNASENNIHSNGLNIFVGANFCGKSTVCELIRRCMTDEINVSVTRSWDETKVAYAFCQFDTIHYKEIISGIIKEPHMNKFYKVFIYKNRTLVRSKLSGSKTIRSFSFEEKEGEQVIESILNKNDDGSSDDKVNDIIEKIKHSKKESSSYEPNWKSLEKKFIATFPLRGIGSVQWTRSKLIGKKHKKRNYKIASERAEIISTILSQKNENKHFNEKDETRIFNFLTYPEVFKFEKVHKKIMVQHNGQKFDLLKTSEGIIEAKVVSLLLAQNDIKTLCLEDPDRGMHPQMIERLKTVLYKSARRKTIIVVTHSPYFVDTITIHRTHVFIRNRLHEPYVCSILNVGDNSDLSKVSGIETLRTLLFATKVLLVEGPTDRDVMQAILTQEKCTELEISKESKEDYLTENMTAYQIIPIGGCDNIEKVQAFCDYIDLPCLCLLDRDKAIGKEKKDEEDKKDKKNPKVTFLGKRKNIEDIEKLEAEICCTESAKFRTREICFETYMEALKSKKKKSTSARKESKINEIISFRQKEKKDEDLKNYIEGLETDFSIENISDLRNKPLQEYTRVFESKKGNSATELEKEHLRKIASFWEKRKKEESFQMYIDSLKEKFKDTSPKKFREDYKNDFEDYLKRLETDRKTFVWRSGELEDAILSSNNWLKIDKVLCLTSQSSSGPSFGSEYKTQALKTLREKLKERLDDCTRKQFAECLMSVDEIKQFLIFVKDETKPE
nr:uncharacterized protein LOC105341935 [Crassostrea gigas]XP_034323679.1 uncharacterized protein LOC105341935 [Crassostrea gigas]